MYLVKVSGQKATISLPNMKTVPNLGPFCAFTPLPYFTLHAFSLSSYIGFCKTVPNLGPFCNPLTALPYLALHAFFLSSCMYLVKVSGQTATRSLPRWSRGNGSLFSLFWCFHPKSFGGNWRQLPVQEHKSVCRASQTSNRECIWIRVDCFEKPLTSSVDANNSFHWHNVVPHEANIFSII